MRDTRENALQELGRTPLSLFPRRSLQVHRSIILVLNQATAAAAFDDLLDMQLWLNQATAGRRTHSE
jgi:hypothetical protein